jgi:hypothetical protein
MVSSRLRSGVETSFGEFDIVGDGDAVSGIEGCRQDTLARNSDPKIKYLCKCIRTVPKVIIYL